MNSRYERAKLIVLPLVLGASLVSCSPGLNSDNTITEGTESRATTVVLMTSGSADLVGILLAAKVVRETPAEELDGIIEVVEGCVAIADTTTKVARLAVWPAGSVLSPMGAIQLANGSLDLGQSVESSKGWIVDSANFSSLNIYDSAASFNQDAERCLPLFDQVMVLSYVKDFGQAE